MDLTEILNGDRNAMDKYAAFWKGQTSFSSGAAKLSKGKYILKKLKMEPGDGLMVVPLFLHLPISFDGTPLVEGVPYVGSFRTAIRLVKMLAAKSEVYKQALLELLGDDMGTLNISDVETVTDKECEVFKRFRHPLVYAKTVMTVKAADSTFAFGTPYAVELAVDPETGDYIDDPKNPLIWNLHRLETECLAAKVKKIREDNDNAGDSRRTDADISDRIKSIWDNRCISNPYSLGTTRVLFFKTNKNYEIDKKIIDGWSATGCRNNEYYIKVNRKISNTFEEMLGTKYDRYEDFLLIKQNTPDFDKNTQGRAAQEITRVSASSDEAIEAMIKDFCTCYAAYRDDMEAWDEKIIKSSAFEYRTISDTAIADIFRNSMSELSSAMRTTEIFSKYQETISRLDGKLSDSLMEASMTEELSSVGDISNEIAEAPKVSEDTPGFGGDTVDTEETSAAMVAALLDDTPTT